MRVPTQKLHESTPSRGLYRVWEPKNEGGTTRPVARWIDAEREKLCNEEESRDQDAAKPIWVGMKFRFEWRAIVDQREVQNRKESGM